MGKKIVFVNAGGWLGLSAAKGSYDNLIECISFFLEGEAEFIEKVETVKSLNEVSKKIKQNEVDVLIFVTRGMLETARDIQESFPEIKVILLTGDIPDEPEEEIIILPKYFDFETFIEALL